MEKLRLFDIYNNSSKETKEKFESNINSKLEVKNKVNKVLYDYSWLDIMEETMPYLDNIIRNPKKFIINEEEVVQIEKARKVTVESIRHLTQHTNYIQDINFQTGEVKPSKILNINKEEDFDMYENRFVYSLLINMRMFISRLGITCSNGSGLKSNKTIKYNASSKIDNEKVDIELKVNVCNNEKLVPSSKGGLSLAQRLDKISLQLSDFMNSEFIKTLEKSSVSLVRSPIKRTNVILKNPNFQKAMELWTFLESYDFNNSESKNIDDEYEDKSQFRDNIDDSFLLDYLIINNALEGDKTVDKEYNATKYYINKIIKNFIDSNIYVDEDKFVKLLRDEFREIKRIQKIKLNRIRKIYQKDIDSYRKMIDNCISILGR